MLLCHIHLYQEIARQKVARVNAALDIVKRGDLRLFLTKMKPDIKKLRKLHQAHPSH